MVKATRPVKFGVKPMIKVTLHLMDGRTAAEGELPYDLVKDCSILNRKGSIFVFDDDKTKPGHAHFVEVRQPYCLTEF